MKDRMKQGCINSAFLYNNYYNIKIKMKRAFLVTGGAGFIAHHLISQILKNTDWEVVTLDRLDFSGNLNRLQDVLKDFPTEDRARVKIVFHDLKAAVNPLIAADIGNVDYILHLALGLMWIVVLSIPWNLSWIMLWQLAISLIMPVV